MLPTATARPGLEPAISSLKARDADLCTNAPYSPIKTNRPLLSPGPITLLILGSPGGWLCALCGLASPESWLFSRMLRNRRR